MILSVIHFGPSNTSLVNCTVVINTLIAADKTHLVEVFMCSEILTRSIGGGVLIWLKYFFCNNIVFNNTTTKKTGKTE